MGLYRSSAGPLPDGRLGDLLILADAATVMLLGRSGVCPAPGLRLLSGPAARGRGRRHRPGACGCTGTRVRMAACDMSACASRGSRGVPVGAGVCPERKEDLM